MSFFFLLRCPGCGHNMKYHSETNLLLNKKKTCVYCGRNYGVRENIVQELTK